jgi:hypothetical protein
VIGTTKSCFDGERVSVCRGVLSDRNVGYRETLRCELTIEVEAMVQCG